MARVLFEDLRCAAKRFREEQGERLAAAIAYHSVFSLAPLFMLGVAVSTLFLGRAEVRARLLEMTASALGPEAAVAVEPWLLAANRPRAGALTTLAGLMAMLFGASRLFLVLQDALNAIYRVAPRHGGFAGYLYRRMLALVLVLAILALVAGAPAAVAGLAWIGRYEWAAACLWLAVEIGLFAAIFRFAADLRAPWLPALAGGALTAALLTAAQSAFALYLNRIGWTSVYGASASLVLLLFWVHLGAQIVLFGAAFVYARYARTDG